VLDCRKSSNHSGRPDLDRKRYRDWKWWPKNRDDLSSDSIMYTVTLPNVGIHEVVTKITLWLAIDDVIVTPQSTMEYTSVASVFL